MDTLSAKPSFDAVPKVSWGRKVKAEWKNSAGALALIVFAPTFVAFSWNALEKYGGSILDTIFAAAEEDASIFMLKNVPRPTTNAFVAYFGWLLFQGLMYSAVPGNICQGQLTPGGNLLSYTTNGLTVWIWTHVLYAMLSISGVIDPAFVAKNWEGLLFAANVYGFALAIYSLAKGYLAPAYPEDCKLSGSWIFDFWAGVELNPRIGKTFDIKFFHNGRPGIVAWTLIDLSWAAYQYQTIGYVSIPMVVVTILHGFYVVDFFANESWYTRTIDISHDHFGFMLAWGDTVFLPSFYTLQAQFLGRYPSTLSDSQALVVLTVGTLGYVMFRSANSQKDYVRFRNGKANIWGSPAKFIKCEYMTSDGKEHRTLLLTSGWWGFSRHANYLADIILSGSMCATCGFGSILPWSYFFFMCILLNHRIYRDEARMLTKYGVKWEEYCKEVPYRLIPGVY